MLKNVSRKNKNILLIGINVVFGIIILFKMVLGIEVSNYLKIWLLACPIIVVSHFFKSEEKSHPSVKDMFLFILTGGAIGRTIANSIKEEVLIVEIVWLLAAIFVAVIHYSPSNKDKYMR